MERDAERSDDTVQEGGLVIEERMNRREGLVEYEGTVEGADQSGDAMQAGAAVLAGTGNTALVDDAATMAGGAGAARGSSDTIPTMSTDNTGANAATADTADGGFLTQVREGMKVFDAGGDEIGKVDSVRAGDPQAATTMGQESLGDAAGDVIAPVGSASGAGTGAGSGLAIGGVVGTGGTDDLGDVDEPFRSQLLRTGFFRVDGKGWLDTDRYITPDQIASVSGDGVALKRHKDDLIRE